jgi:hypothetical protein
MKAISGPMKGTDMKPIATMNNTWKEWQNEHPGTLVLSTETGYNRNYRQTPYTGYEESKQIMFSIEARIDKIHPKEMVLGIEVNNTYKAYPFSVLEKRPSSIITDEVGGKKRSELNLILKKKVLKS